MFGSRTRALTRRVSELEAAAGDSHPPASAPHVAGAGGGKAPVGGGPWWTWTDRAAAMSVPTLAYIRGQLAGGIASMPLERYRNTTDDAGQPTTDKIAPGWCAQPDPAPVVSPSLFWSWLVDDLLFVGQATLVVLARDSDGFPVAFRRITPGQPLYLPDMLALGTYWPMEVTYMGVEVPPEDQIVIAGPHEGICNYGAALIAAAMDLERAAAVSAGEPLPNIDLHQTAGEPIAPEKAKELVAGWKEARAAGATAYTPQNLEARVLGFSAADLQLVEARQYMATQLARMAGVNPVLVSAAMGSSSSYVYTNQADYRRAFLDDVLDCYLMAIEERLSANDVTPRGQFVEFDRDAFTSIPLIERAQIMVGALRSGAAPEVVNQLAQIFDLDFAVTTDTGVGNTPDNPTSPAPSSPAPAPSTNGATSYANSD